MTGPIDFDRLFGASSSPDKDEESQAPASSGIDYTKLFGPQAKTPQQTGAELTQSFAEPAVARTKTAQETIQEIIDQASQPFARDITGSAESYGQYTEGARPGEERAARILRQQKEYLESPQAVDDFFQQSATTIGAPPTGWERLAQIVGSARFFTNRSLLEFNHNNESGFQIGTPIAQAMVHPYEVGKGLVTGLPHFFIGLISKPATLYADALTGGKYLLPEERDEVIRTTIADYAGLFAGGAGGAMIKEMAAGRSILRAGVQSALEKGLPVATEDLITLNQTLPRALAIEGSLGSKIKMGVIEGAIGGATTGFLSGRTPEESRNLAASYAIMALPAGVAFEGVLGRLRKHEIGPLTAIAHDAGQLSIVRQLQAAGEQSVLNGTNTFFALRNANDLAQAAQLAEVGRPVIVQGVSQFRPNEFSLIHLRPDGLMDVSFGGVPDLELATDVAPEIAVPSHIRNMPDEALNAAIEGQRARLANLDDPRDVQDVTELLDVLQRERDSRVYHHGHYAGGPGDPTQSITGEGGKYGSGLYFAKRAADLQGQGMVPAIVTQSPVTEGAATRAFHLSPDLKLFDMSAPVDMGVVQYIAENIMDGADFLRRVEAERARDPGMLNDDLYFMATEAEPGDIPGIRDSFNQHLKNLGYDGIQDPGEVVLFPGQEVGKVALAGELPKVGRGVSGNVVDEWRRTIELIDNFPPEVGGISGQMREKLQAHARELEAQIREAGINPDEIRREALPPDIQLETARLGEQPERYKAPDDVMGGTLTEDYFDPGHLDPETGELSLIAKAGTRVTPAVLAELNAAGYERIHTSKGWAALEKTATSKPLFVSGMIDELVEPMRKLDEAEKASDLPAARQAVTELVNVLVDKRIDFPDIDPLDPNLTLEEIGKWADVVSRDNTQFRRGTEADEFQTGPGYRVGDIVDQPPLEGPASFELTDEGKVGAKVNEESLLQNISSGMYKNKLSVTVIKEAIQNAVDAIRAKAGGGALRVKTDFDTGTFSFEDEGIGMTPKVAAEEFMDPGSSFKPVESSGGLGMAKVALFMPAKAIYMHTVAEVEPGVKQRTTIFGSGNDWLKRKMNYKVSDVPADTPTGTTVTLQYDPAVTVADENSARAWLNDYIQYSRSEASGVRFEYDAYGMGKVQQITAEHLDVIDTPSAKLDMMAAGKKKDYGPEGFIWVRVLNRGLYQFGFYSKIRGVAPEQLIVDVHSKVDVKDRGYPFTTSREELKPEIKQLVDGYVQDLNIAAAKKEALQYVEVLHKSLPIRGTGNLDRPSGIPLMDTTTKLSDELMGAMRNSPAIALFANTLSELYTGISEVLHSRVEQITNGTRAFTAPLNDFDFGVGVGHDYYGMNISKSSLNDVARAANLHQSVSWDKNVILHNPFVTFRYGLMTNRYFGVDVPQHVRLADKSIGTIVHEIMHELARNHNEEFSGVLSNALAIVDTHGQFRRTLEDMWLDLSSDPEFNALYDRIQQEWLNEDDLFKSVSTTELDAASSDLTPEDYSRSIGGRDPTGNQPPTPPGSPEVGPSGGTRPSGSVRNTEARSGGARNKAPEDLGPSRRWRDHAEAVFQVSGFFPNEVVNFLGNDYHYVDPIIGKNGVLEGHKIKGPDGDIVEVPWDQLRHGPDMAVNSFLFDKPQAQQALFDHFMGWTEKFRPGDLDTKPFSDVVASYVAQQGLNPRTIAALHRFLSDRYGELLRKESLAPQERATYTRIVKEISDYRQKSSANLVDAASSNGMYIERQNGALIVRDSQTGAFLELAHSPEEALKFVNQIAADKAPDFTPPGIPDGVNRGLIPVPPPPGGPHTSAFNPHSNGWFGELRDLFNISRLGTHFTGMRQIMISLDNQLGTKLIENVYQPLQDTHLRKYANMHDDMLRAAASARLSRGLTPEQGEQVTMGLETMAPDDMIKAGGLFNRPFTPRELKASQWFVNNQIDVKKAFQYYRALKNLERRSQFYQLPEGDKVEATHKLQASLNVDEAHIEAARIIGKVLQINKPGELSIYGIVRLAEAIMDGHLSPTEYINKHFPPADTEAGVKMRQLHAELQSHFRDLADTFDIPEEQRLGGYFAHLRNFKNDEIIANRDGAPIFTSELLRTGEMSEYDRDPINVLVRYINAGYASKFTREALDNAYAYINKQTAKFNDPAQGEYVKRLITENYINEIRGIPHASTTFAEKLMNKVLDRLGVKSDVSVRRDLVNTFLSLSSSAAIGFRPMQGIRDFHNFSSIYFSRFGPERLGDLFTIMARVTPQELEQAGIIAKSHIGESTAAALAREGVTPTLAPVSVLTAQERLQNSLAARSAPYREAIQRTAELGIKWGLQHNVYQWAHAATYLEASTRALKELNNLSQGKYGAGAEAKAKAYENLFINSYDPPVAAYFDRLVTEGKFKDAADFLGRATSFETVSVFGLANHPAGWGTNFGRLFGQFGNWPVWARTTLTRGLSRGTRAERTRVAVRFGLTQASLALASSALGLNLNSWFLPTAAPLFSAGQHLAAAQDLYDDEKTAELKQAAAAVILGVPGSALFRGGPAFGLIQSSVETGQAYPTAEREGARALTQFPLMLVPGGFLIRDIYEGARMAENGDNPMSAWLRAFGIRSTPDESLLNPAGIVVE